MSLKSFSSISIISLLLVSGCAKTTQVKKSEPVTTTTTTKTQPEPVKLTPPEETPNSDVVTSFQERELSIYEGFAYDKGAELKKGLFGKKVGPYYAMPMGDFVFLANDPKARISPRYTGEGAYHWKAQFWRKRPPKADEVPINEFFESVQNASYDLNRSLPANIDLFKLNAHRQGRDYDKPPVNNWQYDANARFDFRWHGKVMGNYQLLVNRKAGYVYFRDKESCRINKATYSYRYQFWVWKSKSFSKTGIDLQSLFSAIDLSKTQLDRNKPAGY